DHRSGNRSGARGARGRPGEHVSEQPPRRSAPPQAGSAAPRRGDVGNQLRSDMIAELILAMAAIVPTDQTVNVAKGTKLDVNNFAGDVIVKVWDRDAVRVEATHSDRETVDIKQGEQTLSVRSRSTRGGPPRSLDYTITVPKWMAIAVGGNYAD